MTSARVDSVLDAGVAKASVTHDDVQGVLHITVSVPYLTLLTNSKRTQASLSELPDLLNSAVSLAIRSWLSEKLDSGSPSIGSTQP